MEAEGKCNKKFTNECISTERMEDNKQLRHKLLFKKTSLDCIRLLSFLRMFFYLKLEKWSCKSTIECNSFVVYFCKEISSLNVKLKL